MNEWITINKQLQARILSSFFYAAAVLNVHWFSAYCNQYCTHHWFSSFILLSSSFVYAAYACRQCFIFCSIHILLFVVPLILIEIQIRNDWMSELLDDDCPIRTLCSRLSPLLCWLVGWLSFTFRSGRSKTRIRSISTFGKVQSNVTQLKNLKHPNVNNVKA